MEEKTLVDRIRDDLAAKKSEKNIRKALLSENVPKQVVEDAINEAEWKETSPGEKSFDARILDKTDVEPDVDQVAEDSQTKRLSPFFFLFVVIILVWIGLAVTFNVAQTFKGAAVGVEKESLFVPYCMEHVVPADGFSAEELCAVGFSAVGSGDIDLSGVKRQCRSLSYNVWKIDSCADALMPVIDSWKGTHGQS
jgi:hypothetical protein